MNSDWYKGCNLQDKVERKELVQSARPTLEVLKNILEQKMKEEESNASARKQYENAAWPYLQADHLGVMRTYQYMISLLTLEE